MDEFVSLISDTEDFSPRAVLLLLILVYVIHLFILAHKSECLVPLPPV